MSEPKRQTSFLLPDGITFSSKPVILTNDEVVEPGLAALRRRYPVAGVGLPCFGFPVDDMEKDDLLRVIRMLQQKLDDANDSAEKGWEHAAALDRNWESVHRTAMTPIREAVGLPDATVPEIVDAIKGKR